jgi:FKBP-type peptidyl-prolyl cis-trans isomerase SlyD
MVGSPATHDHDHGHDHDPALAHFGAPERVSVGKYVTINYTLRTNGTIRHIRSAVWGDEPLAYQQGSGRRLARQGVATAGARRDIWRRGSN